MNQKYARWPSKILRAEILLPVLVAACSATASAQVPQAGDRTGVTADIPASQAEILYLQIILNATPQPDLLRVERRDGLFIADALEMRRMGFALQGVDSTAVVLNELPGVSLRYDSASQRLLIDAPLSALSLQVTRLGAHGDRPTVADATTSPGAVLNYDAYVSRTSGAEQLSLGTDLRVFGVAGGVFNNTAISRIHRISGDRRSSDSVRLDTSMQWSFPDHAISVVAGDGYTGFLDWTRPVRFGGLQIGRNFSLQPYRITTPLPSFLGEAVVPSSIELYVNGIRQSTQQVPTGPFELTTAPGVTGAGIAQMVVTDAFGRVRTLDFPFYSSQRLMAKGLGDWSVSLGAVREDYGLRSFSYGNDLIASGNFRYGVSDRFTAEGHAEGSGDLVNAGAGGAWLLGYAGVVAASYARSSLGGSNGSQRSLAYDWNNGRFNISLETRRTNGDYLDLAALYSALPPKATDRALVGYSSAALGSVSLSHVRLEYGDPGFSRSRFVGAFWSRSFGDWSAHVSWNRDLERDDSDSLQLGVLVPLGRTRQASASWQRTNDRDYITVGAAQPIPFDGGFGWRVQARAGDHSGGQLEAGWMGDHGRLTFGVADLGGESYGYAQLNGSVVALGGHGFLARDINDAFAVVSTGGIAGVPIKRENRVVGHSNRNGMLLVTGLNAWQHNKLSIDPMDLPAGVRVTEVDKNATPTDRAGTMVEFSVRPVQAALIVLHDASGKPLPLGSRVRVEGREDVEAIVGHDGETYLETLEVQNLLRVETETGTCLAKVDYPAVADEAIPRIGPIVCSLEVMP